MQKDIDDALKHEKHLQHDGWLCSKQNQVVFFDWFFINLSLVNKQILLFKFMKKIINIGALPVIKNQECFIKWDIPVDYVASSGKGLMGLKMSWFMKKHTNLIWRVRNNIFVEIEYSIFSCLNRAGIECKMVDYLSASC